MTTCQRSEHLARLYSDYSKSRASFAAMIARFLSPNADLRSKAILDIGCGDGIIASTVAAMGADTTALEYDIGRVEDMVKFGVEFKLVRGDAHALPFRPRSFDSAILADFLEHLRDPECVMRETARVLAPAVRWYVGATNRTSHSTSARPTAADSGEIGCAAFTRNETCSVND
jgi:ubiquinone/menaquinone biosynthesis C-methylase UbiE